MRALKVGFAADVGCPPSEIQGFYRQHWKRRVALSDDRFYRWQFVDTPRSPGVDECVVATIDGALAGVMGSASRRFFIEGQARHGAELTTWVVAEEHRGKGIGPAILEFLKQRYEVMVGTGISVDALSVYLRAGFHYVRHLPRYVRVLNLEALEPYCRVEPLARKLVRQRLAGCTCAGSSANAGFDFDQVEAAWHAFRGSHCSFERSAQDMHWRYLSHPYFEHSVACLQAAHGAPICLATRVDVLPNGARLLRVLDLFGDPAMHAAAISHLDTMARSLDVAALDFFGTDVGLGASLRTHGWFSVLDEPFLQVPHLFAPVELREPATTSLILWARERMDRLLDASRLYVTKGDTDLDRPTMDFLDQHGR